MNAKEAKLVVFADLDGSLLNDKYECGEIEPIIRKLLSLDVAIVFASSKTRSEIDFYRKKWQVSDPFISENGSAIVIPEDYFKSSYEFTRQKFGYKIIELGTPYRTIREKLAASKNQTGVLIVGFGDMSAEEISRDSGLPLHLAQLAKKREYSEPFKILEGNVEEFLNAVRKEGLCCTMGGRYLHALGTCDKGKATSILINLYLTQYNRIVSIGIGDSPNDLAMLKIVDKSFFVDSSENREAIWKKIESIALT